MKKTILFYILCLLSTVTFSQVQNQFNLTVINQSFCEYTVTGNYYSDTTQGTITFLPDSNVIGVYIGYVPNIDSLGVTICASYNLPCSGEQCINDTLYLGNGQGTGQSFTILLQNTDSDSDGWTDDQDCDPLNGSVNPGALEICGDSIDNNCDGLLETYPSFNMYFANDSLVQEENTIYLINSSNCDSYSWDFGNGDSSQMAFPTSQYDTTGTFQICVTGVSQDGCSSDTCFTFTIIDSTSSITLIVQEYLPLIVYNELNSNLSIWPNPVNNTLNIKNPLSKGTIQIISLDGKIVQSHYFNTRTNQIDVSNIEQGMYILNVSDNKNTIKSLFIKQ